MKRTPPGGRAPVVGLYITYHRREDAARAIAAVDGSPSPGGGSDVLRASYGTTKYCVTFLRNVSCANNSCMDLHEWGDEKDCFTKEDLTTLKHTMKDTETRQRNTLVKKDEMDCECPSSHRNILPCSSIVAVGLPRSAGWGQKSNTLGVSSQGNASSSSSTREQSQRERDSHRPTRRGHRGTRSTEQRPSGSSRQQNDRRTPNNKTPSQASSSRPNTPAPASSAVPQRPITPASVSTRAPKVEKEAVSNAPQRTRSPASSVSPESDLGSHDLVSSPIVHASSAQVPSAPPGLPISQPPALLAPPGLPIAAPATPTTHDPSSNPSYQMSTQARALLDDVRARRKTDAPPSFASPFPDLDRTLQSLTGGLSGGGFNFTLDPRLAGETDQTVSPLPDLDSMPGYFDPAPIFAGLGQRQSPALAFAPPPGLSYAGGVPRPMHDNLIPRPPTMERQSTTSSSYTGSFNPFADAGDDRHNAPTRRPSSSLEEETGRGVSRFGFARQRQNSSLSAASSPMISAANSTYAPSDHVPSPISAHIPWAHQRQPEFGPPPGLPLRTATPGSMRGSPLVQHAIPYHSYATQPSRFQPFDNGGETASLKDFIGISRDRADSTRAAPSGRRLIVV